MMNSKTGSIELFYYLHKPTLTLPCSLHRICVSTNQFNSCYSRLPILEIHSYHEFAWSAGMNDKFTHNLGKPGGVNGFKFDSCSRYSHELNICCHPNGIPPCHVC